MATVPSEVPVIDLSNSNEKVIEQQIAAACSSPGFFQVTNHGVSSEIIEDFRLQSKRFFNLNHQTKVQLKRDAGNARGFFDDELTKQRRDWKECIDIGVPGSRDWSKPDDCPQNACLDGFNRLPTNNENNSDEIGSLETDYRKAVVNYFDACSDLSHRLAVLMARGLGRDETDPFLVDMQKRHTSYLRSNYYPPCMEGTVDNVGKPLGISPHYDAGFLTVLLQDDDCHSLQVLSSNALQEGGEQQWVTVQPVPGAFTINTGDMAQVWSNDRYKAPLHRVLTNESKARYSAPFFYNPGYSWLVDPIVEEGSLPHYHPVSWGYFRALRFAGDLTDLGVEIQVKQFHIGQEAASNHLSHQNHFLRHGMADRPFDVEEYKRLILFK